MDLNQKSSADHIIEHLIAIDVDGETMEYIIEKVGMNQQMLRQLIMGSSDILINELLQEKYIQASRLVTIYYNDVFISEESYEIYANCPYVNIPIGYAEEYAENKIENREWDAYCIPELVDPTHTIIYHE